MYSFNVIYTWYNLRRSSVYQDLSRVLLLFGLVLFADVWLKIWQGSTELNLNVKVSRNCSKAAFGFGGLWVFSSHTMFGSSLWGFSVLIILLEKLKFLRHLVPVARVSRLASPFVSSLLPINRPKVRRRLVKVVSSFEWDSRCMLKSPWRIILKLPPKTQLSQSTINSLKSPSGDL